MRPISASDLRWMRLAIAQAESATHEKWRVGAVLVRGGSVLSTGCNKYRNDPSIVGLNGVSYHAEDVAIKRAGTSKGATLFVARVTKSGMLGLAKPCHKCLPLLEENGVHSIVWTHPYGITKDRIS